MHLNKDTFGISEYVIGRPYLGTTQNLSYIPKLAPSGERAFTILAAGDSVFQLAMSGFQQITAMEANPAQIAFFYLRLAAVFALNYKDFCDFLFHPSGRYFLDSDVYFQKVRPYLENYGREPMGKLDFFFKHHPFELTNLVMYALHFRCGIEHCSDKVARESLDYLKNPKTYQELKRRLKCTQIRVREGDAMEFLASTQEAYGWIDISNILLYYYQYKSNFGPNCFADSVEKLSAAWGQMAGEHPTMVLDYMFGMGKGGPTFSSGYADKSQAALARVTVGIYAETSAELRRVFGEVKTLEVRKLDANATPLRGSCDVVLYLQK